jgi:2-amino-4-hydroxy-6-hydroxymethyldihydropteridine diphosphokinase
MKSAYVGIGSNAGDRAQFVRRAADEMQKTDEVEVVRTSSLYETSPIGGPPQRSFVNMVAEIRTELDPRALLDACKRIERVVGREPSEIRWGPRVIDIDILLYEQDKVSEPDLEIPHPRLTQRNFVLIPLLEIDPEASDPWGTPYRDALPDAEGEVRLLEAF